MTIKNRKICYFVTQHCTSLLSIVIHMHHKTTLSHTTRMVVERMVCSSVRSKDGIKLSLDTPLNNRPCLDIVRSEVLRQYFGRNVTEYLGQSSSESSGNDTIVKIYTYSSGSGTSSVGMDPYNFVTREMKNTMECMANELYCIIQCNSFTINSIVSLIFRVTTLYGSIPTDDVPLSEPYI